MFRHGVQELDHIVVELTRIGPDVVQDVAFFDYNSVVRNIWRLLGMARAAFANALRPVGVMADHFFSLALLQPRAL